LLASITDHGFVVEDRLEPVHHVISKVAGRCSRLDPLPNRGVPTDVGELIHIIRIIHCGDLRERVRRALIASWFFSQPVSKSTLYRA
jgi:hypothetical protein